MKVKQLIGLLKSADPESDIILSSDSEGNHFSPLADASLAIYTPDTTWSGDILDVEWSSEEAGYDEDEWEDMLNNCSRSVVLWPTN